MNGITGIERNGYQGSRPPAARREAERAAPETDRVELTRRIRGNTMSRLRALFPGTEVTVIPDGEELSDRALSIPGRRLWVSEGFLKGMETDEDAFSAGTDLLRGALEAAAREAGAASGAAASFGAIVTQERVTTYWTAPEAEEAEKENAREPDALEKYAERMKEALKQGNLTGGMKIRVSDPECNPRALLARLAQAESVPPIQELLVTVNQTIFSLQLVHALGDKDQKAEARTMLAKMKRVAQRARTKIKELDEESALRRGRERAKRLKAEKEVRQLQAELRKRRTVRKAKELFQQLQPLGGEQDPVTQQLEQQLQAALSQTDAGGTEIGMEMAAGDGAASGASGADAGGESVPADTPAS